MKVTRRLEYLTWGLAPKSVAWVVLKGWLLIVVATIASWLLVLENDLTDLLNVSQIVVVVTLLNVPEMIVSAFHSGVFTVLFGFFSPDVLEARGVTYVPIAVTAAYVAWQIIRRRFRYTANLMIVLQLLLAVTVVVSATKNEQSLLDTPVRAFIIANIGAFLAIQAFAFDERKLSRLLISFGLFSVLLAILSYQSFPEALHQLTRLELWDRNVILVGRWGARGLIFAFVGAALLFRQRVLARWFSLAAALALVPLVVVSNQRGVALGVMVALAAAGTALLLARDLDRKWKAIGWFAGLMLIVCILAVPMFLNWGYRYSDMLALGMSDPGITYRRTIWEDVWGHFRQHPVLGGGIQSFESTRGYYAHNIFLEIAGDLGIVGVSVFAATLLLGSYYGYRLLREPQAERAKPYALLALSLLAFDLVQAQVSANVGTNSVIWFDIGAITALYLGACKGLWANT